MAKNNGIKTILGSKLKELNITGSGLGDILFAGLKVPAKMLPNAIKDFISDMDIEEFKKKYGLKGTVDEYAEHFKQAANKIANPNSIRLRNENALRQAAARTQKARETKTVSKSEQPTGGAANIPVASQVSGSYTGSADWNNPEYVKALAVSTAREVGIPEQYIPYFLGLLNQESGFRHYSGNQIKTSGAGAIGLGQLMPSTAKSLGVNPLDPMDNLRGSAIYFKNSIAHYNGDIPKALASYNAGYGAVDKYNGIPPYAETQNYVKSIISNVGKGTYNNYQPLDSSVSIPPTTSEMASAQNAATANQTLQNFANAAQPLDDRLMREGLGDQELYRAMAQQALTNTRIMPTEEEVAQLNKPYIEAAKGLQDYATTANENLARQITPEQFIDPMQQRLNDVYNAYYEKVNPLNPYTQMSQIAPQEQIDIDRLRGAAKGQMVGNAILNAQNPNSYEAYDFAGNLQNMNNQIQAAQLANATGLSREDFLQGRGLDYLNAQKAEAQRIADMNKLLELYKGLVSQDIVSQAGTTNQAISSGATLAGKGADVTKEYTQNLGKRLEKQAALDQEAMQQRGGLYGKQIETAGGLQKAQEQNYTNILGKLQEAQNRLDVENLKGQYNLEKAGITAGGQGNIKPSDINAFYGQVATWSLDPNLRKSLPELVNHGVNNLGISPEWATSFLKSQGFGGQ